MKRFKMIVPIIALFLGNSALRAINIEYVGSTPWTGFNDVKICGQKAYCSSSKGIVVLGITDPSNPILLRQMFLPSGARLFAERDTVYLARDTNGFDIIDFTDVANPGIISHCDFIPHAHDVFVEGNYAYVSDDSLGLAIANISDIAHPVLAGSFPTPGRANGICVSNHYAYIADNWESGIQIINVEDPANPSFASAYRDTLYGAMNVFVSGDYAYVANFPSDPVILDISNPYMPIRASRIWSEMGCTDVQVVGNYLYSSSSGFGLAIYDISNPYLPVRVGISDTLTYLSNMDICENYAYLLSSANGLHVLDISQPNTPRIIGNYTVRENYHLIASSGNYAFAGNVNGGINIINIADPGQPYSISKFDTLNTPLEVKIDGNLLYSVAHNRYYYDILQIFDISTPESPMRLGGFMMDINAFGIYGVLSNGYYYIANNEHSLDIIDVRNPSNIDIVGWYDIGDTVVSSVAVSGDYAYLMGGATRNRIINISDRRNPGLMGFFSLPRRTYNTLLFGNYMYAVTSDSLLIIDVSDPVNPLEIGVIELPMTGFNTRLNLSGNYLYVCPVQNSIRVLEVSDPTSPVQVASLPVHAWDLSISDNYIYAADGTVSIWRYEYTGIGQEPSNPIADFSISGNYPNPFNPATTIRYDLPKSSEVTLQIFDILGRKIVTLSQGQQSAGAHSIIWNAGGVSSGVYFYKIRAGDYIETRKMLLMK